MAVAYINNSFKVSFYVVDSESVPVLGLKTSEPLQLIKITFTYHFQVKDNIKSVFTPSAKLHMHLN